MRLPEHVAAAIMRLEAAGFETWAVGGCVRDSLRGAPPHDWDLCTAARPEEMRAATDFCCPDLAIVGPAEITGYITELGVIPPAAMFGMSLRYIAKIEGEDE